VKHIQNIYKPPFIKNYIKDKLNKMTTTKKDKKELIISFKSIVKNCKTTGDLKRLIKEVNNFNKVKVNSK